MGKSSDIVIFIIMMSPVIIITMAAIIVIGVYAHKQTVMYNQFCQNLGYEESTDHCDERCMGNPYHLIKIECDKKKIFEAFVDEVKSCTDYDKWDNCEKYQNQKHLYIQEPDDRFSDYSVQVI